MFANRVSGGGVPVRRYRGQRVVRGSALWRALRVGDLAAADRAAREEAALEAPFSLTAVAAHEALGRRAVAAGRSWR